MVSLDEELRAYLEEVPFHTGKHPRVAKGLKKNAMREQKQSTGEYRKITPEAALMQILDSIMSEFRDDFIACGQDFMKIRYHVGEPRSETEFYSDAYSFNHDNWQTVKQEMTEHIAEEFGDLEKEIADRIPVRMIFFHDPRTYADKKVEYKDILGRIPDAPDRLLDTKTDFGFWIEMSSKEFTEYVKEGRLPESVSIGFDMTYFWNPDKKERQKAFLYTRPWEVFWDNAKALSQLTARPVTDEEAPGKLISAHTSAIQNLLNAHNPEKEVLYRPSVKMTLSQEETVFSYRHNGNLPDGLVSAVVNTPDEFRTQYQKNGFVLIKKWPQKK